MTDTHANPPPDGVRAIAALFALTGLYLGIVGAVMLVSPDAISILAGAFFMFGLERYGPYMFLLMTVAGSGIAWGLLRLNNIVRHIAMLIAIAGIVLLVPFVSAATVMVKPAALALGGLGIIVRVIVVWYLSRGDIAEQFKSPPRGG
jgi:hypothetical protein